MLLVSAPKNQPTRCASGQRLGPIPPGLLILSATDVGAVIAAMVESAARAGCRGLDPGGVDRPVGAR